MLYIIHCIYIYTNIPASLCTFTDMCMCSPVSKEGTFTNSPITSFFT